MICGKVGEMTGPSFLLRLVLPLPSWSQPPPGGPECFEANLELWVPSVVGLGVWCSSGGDTNKERQVGRWDCVCVCNHEGVEIGPKVIIQ